MSVELVELYLRLMRLMESSLSFVMAGPENKGSITTAVLLATLKRDLQ